MTPFPCFKAGTIPQSFSRKIAGKIAGKAIQDGDISILKEYKYEWETIFEKELLRSKLRRQLLESNWNQLDMIVKKCWTAFREYYEE